LTALAPAAWNDIMVYYIQAFKTGTYPKVDRDRIFMWARLWPANADAPNDRVGKPTRWQDVRLCSPDRPPQPTHHFTQTEDAAWAVVFATSPATVVLTCNTMSVTATVPAGVTKLKLKLVTPGQITASMTRPSNSGDGDDTVISFAPHGFEFRLNPVTYNFNALVVASP
jgi:glucan endo-1,3-alpha-glucosidase